MLKSVGEEVDDKKVEWPPGRELGATRPTSLSAVFDSFRLIFGRAIIPRDGLDAWMLFPERLEHAC